MLLNLHNESILYLFLRFINCFENILNTEECPFRKKPGRKTKTNQNTFKKYLGAKFIGKVLNYYLLFLIELLDD